MTNPLLKQLAAVALVACSSVEAGIFYSIDTANDALVSIDSSSGHVNVIGQL